MIKTGDILTLKIEKVVYEGFGLARFDNRTVFVKDTVDGDIVRAKVVFENKSYIKAKLHGILEPSCHRVKPLCALSKPCGGCDFSHIDYDYQLKIKENIVKEIFRNIEGVEFLPILKSPLKYNYRFKTQYPVSQTKKSKRLLIGYYKEKTHEIINIKYCPIHPEIIDKITDFIKENWKLGAYDEKTHKGLLRHVNIRISNLSSEILLTLVLNINEIEFNKIKEEINNFCNLLTEEFKYTTGRTARASLAR